MEKMRFLINDSSLLSMRELYDIIYDPRRKKELTHLINANKIVVYINSNKQIYESRTRSFTDKAQDRLIV